jgi:hypothetical protein
MKYLSDALPRKRRPPYLSSSLLGYMQKDKDKRTKERDGEIMRG